MKDKAKIIEKWYKELGFPKEYDEQFYALLNESENIPILKPDSNILKFQTLFEAVRPVEMDSILHFVLKYGITREELPYYEAKSDFAKKVKEYALSGGKFYNTLGVRSR